MNKKPKAPDPRKPQVIARLDIGVRVRFGRNATGIAITTTDQDGRKDTSAEIIPKEPPGKKHS